MSQVHLIMSKQWHQCIREVHLSHMRMDFNQNENQLSNVTLRLDEGVLLVQEFIDAILCQEII